MLKQSDDTCDVILSVTQCNTVSKCIEFVISLGFIPCLIPSVWQSFENKQKSVIQLTENISPNTVMKTLFKLIIYIKLLNKPFIMNTSIFIKCMALLLYDF